MSWLSSAIDKGRKALGLPVISINNAGAIAGAVAKQAAGFVPGGSILVNAYENLQEENPGMSIGDYAQETADNLWGTVQTGIQAVKVQTAATQTAYDVTHSPTTVYVLAAVALVAVVVLIKGK